jgi:hypothetical protein
MDLTFGTADITLCVSWAAPTLGMLKFLTNDQFPKEVKDVREILMARLRGPPRHAVDKKSGTAKGSSCLRIRYTTTLKIFNNMVILV